MTGSKEKEMANDSTVKFKADISQLKAEMQAASRAVKVASSEFKAATAGMDNWSRSADGLQAKIKQLNTQLEAQKKKVEIANKELELTAKAYGENSAEADRARISLNNYMAALAKTEKELSSYESDLEDCKNGTGEFADELDNIDGSAQNAADGFTVMKGALADLVADGIRAAISAIKDLAKQTFEVGSNFESAMSKVGAVSGASAEDIELLTEKAKEMGESTIFSATQSAEAFNYMAMAGWKTEDMLSGIEGIMNLAAASGSDLATTSDIVTDALTAMGYGAEDAGRLADVMAAASSNANTNVEMMGQTFQYAAPIIGALGMNMEDAAVAIGLMANAGIKGEKSGTALRSILTRLSAPPKECAEAMDELGISLTDSNGKMKSMDEVMNDLRKAFSGMSETQQTANAKAIAGQEAMSGLLAIVNAAPEDVNKLTDAVNNSAGAAKGMADTMNDNVGGALTLLKSNIEGKMITVYENASDSIKKALGAISDKLNDIDWDKVGKKIGKGVESLVNLFIKIINHGEDIITVIKSIGTVLISTFVATKLLSFVAGIMKAVETFKTLKIAVEGATAAQKLFNIAQAASPVGIAVAAVAGLAAGLLVLAGNSNEAAEATVNLTDAEKAQIDKVNEMADAYSELKSRRDDSMSGIQSEFGYYQSLADELESLIGANGKVKEGYEDRAKVITTTLNDALGTEIKMTEGVIQNYEKVIETIDQVIEKKKAEAILSANQELYTEAIKHQNEALKEYASTRKLLNDKEREQAELQKEANDLRAMSVEQYAELNGFGRNYSDAADSMNKKQAELNASLKETDRAVYEARKAYKEAESTYTGYISTIKNYEGLSAAIVEGDSKKISDSLAKMQYDFVSAENGTEEILKKQVDSMKQNYEELSEAVRSGAPGVTQEMVDQAADMVDKATEELSKLQSRAGKEGTSAENEFVTKFGAGKYGAQQAGKQIADQSNKGLETGQDGAKQAGSAQGSQFASGLQEQGSGAYSAGNNVANSARSGLQSVDTTQSGVNFTQGFINGMKKKVVDAFNVAENLGKGSTQALKKGQQEGSPSKITYKSGLNFVQGYINGIVAKHKDLVKTVQNMVGTVVKTMLKADYNYDEVAQTASDKFSDTMSKKLESSLERMQYANEQKIKIYDNRIAKLQEQSAWKQQELQNKYDATDNKDTKKAIKAQIESIKKEYEGLIDAQKKSKEAYQKASSIMVSEYTKAMQEYQKQAEKLINDTITGISDKYTEKYNTLIDKQNTLIEKMKSAGELFEISGAGVMTVNDLKEQTKAINDYASKLQKIKSKVSDDLFDQITTYDMKEGSAFLDQLLAMSESDLKAYNKAYEQKMEAANKASANIYKKDFSKLSKDYKQEVKDAFKGLDDELKKMGSDAIKSFITGMKEKSSYMTQDIKNVISQISTSFKEAAAPKGVAFMENSSRNFNAVVDDARGRSTSTSSVVNNYSLVQNNTSPKALTALETYQARRQQISMLKAVT